MRLPFRVMGSAGIERARSLVKRRAVPVETVLTRLVRAGLQAGNGRGHMADRSEIERRLTVDGIAVDREDLEKALRLMFNDGRVGQTADGKFYVLDDSPLFVEAKAGPPPSVFEIESHGGWEPWGQEHGFGGGWVSLFPPE